MMKRRPGSWAACLLLLAACGQADKGAKNSVTVKLPPVGVPAAPESSYSSLDPTSCNKVRSGRRCEGMMGYALETSGRGITIIAPDGRRSGIDLSKLASRSAARLGAKAEWRGPTGGQPIALIVRVNSDLVVARLAYPACIVAVIKPQSSQNEKAREIADEKLPACVNG